MGIVASQSFKNIIFTYLGFLIGAINTLFLYTKFLSDSDYGLVGYILSLAHVIMPLMAFGAHNTLVKFYTSYKTRVSLHSFLTLVLLLPLVMAIPLSFICYSCYDVIANALSKTNPIVKHYLWHGIITAIALAYFEVFFAWVKVHMKTVFGNFMKEVFHRVGAMLLLVLLYFELLNVEQFIFSLVIVYVIRMLVMCAYAFSVKPPVIIFKHLSNKVNVLKYAFLMIIAGSIASVLLEVDKVMLGYYIPIKQIAYYNVAVFVTAVIAVPQRSMHQILLPLSAKYLNEKDFDALGNLYKRSALNLFIVSGLIFLLIIGNINELYHLIAEEYRVGIFTVLVIGATKLYDAYLGSNNAILFNSDYYRIVLLLGVFLTVLMVVLNVIFIPVIGINGAALATFLAVFTYNTIKLVFVYKKFKIHPFSSNILKIAVLILLSIVLFYFWEFSFHPIINIALKSILITSLFVFVVYKFNFSEDISFQIKKYLRIK
ncbi:polysaccharide biosynthesis C-terminal domain-containing protein [uncultured Algibacter sp.]|uniref:lipopolysaccharide biosynthesis protein n=1 Tax=uncultured Algibacter sp. TaxID=298659 RepID=UPI0032169129